MIYLQTKFDIPSCNGSLVITSSGELNTDFLLPPEWSFNVLQKCDLNKVSYSSESLFHNESSGSYVSV